MNKITESAIEKMVGARCIVPLLYANKNIWLPQKRMSELFGCGADNISLHLKNIYKEKELDESSTTELFSVVQIEGKREVYRNVTCYSLAAARHQQGKYNEKQSP